MLILLIWFPLPVTVIRPEKVQWPGSRWRFFIWNWSRWSFRATCCPESLGNARSHMKPTEWTGAVAELLW